MYYREMLESIYVVDVKRVAQMLQDCIAFSIQIDGREQADGRQQVYEL